MSEQLESRVARIESDVEHVKTNTANLVVELRRTNERIDATNRHIEGIRETLVQKTDGALGRLGEKFDRLDKSLDGLLEDIRSAKIWGLFLYFTLAGGLLILIARTFEWI
jgi:chromosome segregation ATPase